MNELKDKIKELCTNDDTKNEVDRLSSSDLKEVYNLVNDAIRKEGFIISISNIVNNETELCINFTFKKGHIR